MADVTVTNIDVLVSSIDAHTIALNESTLAMQQSIIALNAVNDTINNTFVFDFDTFNLINGYAFVIFVVGFGIGTVVKTLRKV